MRGGCNGAELEQSFLSLSPRVQIVKMRLKALGGCKPPERARELGRWDRVIPSRAHRSGLARDLGDPRSSNIPVARSEP